MTDFIIGFTGTRNGMTNESRFAVRAIVARYIMEHGVENCVGLHGDCVGADEDFDKICVAYGMRTWQRPCSFEGNPDHSLRAYTKAQVITEATNPMPRNREIAKQCHVMIGCPPTREELKKGSGSWATIRYGRKAGKLVHKVFPDGGVDLDQPKQPELFT